MRELRFANDNDLGNPSDNHMEPSSFRTACGIERVPFHALSLLQYFDPEPQLSLGYTACNDSRHLVLIGCAMQTLTQFQCEQFTCRFRQGRVDYDYSLVAMATT